MHLRAVVHLVIQPSALTHPRSFACSTWCPWLFVRLARHPNPNAFEWLSLNVHPFSCSAWRLQTPSPELLRMTSPGCLDKHSLRPSPSRLAQCPHTPSHSRSAWCPSMHSHGCSAWRPRMPLHDLWLHFLYFPQLNVFAQESTYTLPNFSPLQVSAPSSSHEHLKILLEWFLPPFQYFTYMLAGPLFRASTHLDDLPFCPTRPNFVLTHGVGTHVWDHSNI